MRIQNSLFLSFDNLSSCVRWSPPAIHWVRSGSTVRLPEVGEQIVREKEKDWVGEMAWWVDGEIGEGDSPS